MCIQCCSPVLALAPTSEDSLLIIPSLLGGKGKDDFSQLFILFSSFRSATTAFENFEFSLGVKGSMPSFICPLCLLFLVYTMLKFGTEVSREVVWRRPRMDSH